MYGLERVEAEEGEVGEEVEELDESVGWGFCDVFQGDWAQVGV